MGLLRPRDLKNAEEAGTSSPRVDKRRGRGARLLSLKEAAGVAASRLGKAGKTSLGSGNAREARYGAAAEGDVKRDDGSYRIPDPILDERELSDIDALKERYDRLREPGVITRAGKELSKLIPKGIGRLGSDAFKGLASQKLYEGGIKVT
ncbi:MAG: hypothetical protein E7001_04965 [Coriobacteriaceae bacterium]|nr:hypothetical protein [Coriobacteriaceae bacterium]